MSATEQLVAFVHRLDPAALPAPLVNEVCTILLDLTGVAIAGTRTPMFLAAASFANDQFAAGPATVIGSRRPLAAAGAAWANGIAASGLDFDEGHRMAMGHPAAAVVPAALAAAEMCGASGGELIAAVAAGYEVAVRASATASRLTRNASIRAEFGGCSVQPPPQANCWG